MPKTELGRWDLALCVLVGLLALALVLVPAALTGEDEITVTVRLAGEPVLQTALRGADIRFPVAGEYPLTVVIRENAVWVEDATCPNEDCQRMGKITRPGQSIACLPGRISVSLSGNGAGADVIVG